MVKLIFQNIRQYQIADLIKKAAKSCVSSIIYVHNFHYVRFLPLFSTSHSFLKIKPKLLTRAAPSMLRTVDMPAIPPIHLHLIFEISSSKNQV